MLTTAISARAGERRRNMAHPCWWV
jgi:hypothetical protein